MGTVKKAKRFNHQTSYIEYTEEVDHPEPSSIYFAVITEFLYEINRAIIVEKYEWKVPFFGGFLRIYKKPVKDKEGNFVRWWYYWKWDRSSNIMHWPKASVWSFKAVEGRCKRRIPGKEDIGEVGLWKHKEALKGNYDVMLKMRPAKRVSFKEFVDSL